MTLFKKIDPQKLNRLPTLLVKIFIALIVVVALIISANKLMEFKKIKDETREIEKTRNELLQTVGGLRYYLDFEINDAYKEKMAREMGYCYPDEIIYYVE